MVPNLTSNMNGSISQESSFVKSRAKLFSSPKSEDELECDGERKKPSYVNLSCAVSGYSGLNRYDSKARQEIRSRESSRDRLPMCITKSRDSSPSPTKPFPDHLASRRSIGLILSLDRSTPVPSLLSPVTIASASHQTIGQRSKSVDRGYLRQNFLNGYLKTMDKPPPRFPTSSSVGVSSTFANRTSNHYSSTHKSTENVTDSASNEVVRGRLRVRNNLVGAGVQERTPQQSNEEKSDLTNKSVIQQRIERLYGPAALARGFFKVKNFQRKGPKHLSRSLNNNNDQSVDEVEASSLRTRAQTTDGIVGENCAEQPPVFRHLNAEFRQQLMPKKSRSRSIEKQLDEPVVPAAVSPPNESVDEPIAGTCPNGDTLIINGSKGCQPEELAKQETPSLAGHQFLKILDEEISRLKRLIVVNEAYLAESEVTSSEELTGKIRAAVGKCKLLLAQKFEQFAGLCRKNLTQSPDEPFPTTGEDLAGFWDMVNIQVDHINTLFGEIQALKANGWVDVIQTGPNQSGNQKVAKKSRGPANNKSVNTPRSAKAEEAAKAREEARKKMLEDRKKLMKAKRNQEWVISEKSESLETEPGPKSLDGEETVV